MVGGMGGSLVVRRFCLDGRRKIKLKSRFCCRYSTIYRGLSKPTYLMIFMIWDLWYLIFVRQCICLEFLEHMEYMRLVRI